MGLSDGGPNAGRTRRRGLFRPRTMCGALSYSAQRPDEDDAVDDTGPGVHHAADHESTRHVCEACRSEERSPHVKAALGTRTVERNAAAVSKPIAAPVSAATAIRSRDQRRRPSASRAADEHQAGPLGSGAIPARSASSVVSSWYPLLPEYLITKGTNGWAEWITSRS